MKKPILLLISVLIISSGCTSVPFRQVELTPLPKTSAPELIAEMRAGTPDKFTVMNSIVFNIHRHSIVAIGYTSVDVPENSMSVVALNPMGVKVFEFTEVNGKMSNSYVIEALAQKGDAASMIASNIRCMYFDRIPSETAEFRQTGTTFVFTEQYDNDTLRYVFGGTPRVLIEKQYFQDGKKIWTVTYHEYMIKEGKKFPAGIAFSSHRYRYRLFVSLKEICNWEETK